MEKNIKDAFLKAPFLLNRKFLIKNTFLKNEKNKKH
jgi:hypothetical protein